MKKYYIILALAVIGLAYKGYCNYTSWPDYRINRVTIETEDKDELDIFFGDGRWNPVGRQKPVFSSFLCEHGGNRNGSKYIEMEMTRSERAKKK